MTAPFFPSDNGSTPTEANRAETDRVKNAKHRSRWRKWLGTIPPSTRDLARDVPETPAPDLAPDGTDGTAKRRLVGLVADFLIDHDLEILPFTLTIAYDCITGGNPRLTQAILERAEQGLPVTLAWLEAATAALSNDAQADALATLAEQVEASLCDLGRTMAGARSANGTYSTALEAHVADLQHVRRDEGLVLRLTDLTRRMLDHTLLVENELARSETRIAELQAGLDEARLQANQDHLTGLPNRRAFDHIFDRELRAATMNDEALCVAFCDIDHFKRINDAHGHPAGDRVIRYVAETLGRIADAKCHVARHGGEEFAVVLRGMTLADGWARLDAARAEIAHKRLINRTNDQPFGQITFSGGIADARSHPGKSAALKAADEALYAAKDSGRNRIVIAGPSHPPVREVA